MTTGFDGRSEWEEGSLGALVNHPLGHIWASVRSSPDAAAVECSDGTLSYCEFWNLACVVAERLAVAGTNAGEAVLVAARPGPVWAAAIVGAWMASAVYVPVDTGLPIARLAFYATDSNAKFVLTDGTVDDTQWPSHLHPVELPGFAAPSHLTSDAYVAPQALIAGVDSPAYAIYTSGSTGTPKAVLIGHNGLASRMSCWPELYDLRAEDKVAQLASPSFDASLWEVLTTLAVGGCLSFPPENARHPGDLLSNWMIQRGVSIFTCTPTQLAAMPRLRVPTLRLVVLGGEALHPEPLRFWFDNYRIANAYGPTEATVEAIVATDVDPDAPMSIGRPLPQVEAFVIDDDGNVVPGGGEGELHLGGAGIAIGYMNRPDLTAEKFRSIQVNGQAKQLYRTGDRVRTDDSGNYYFLGRTDSQTNIGGVRVEAGEIEALLLALPQIQSAVVLAICNDDRWVLAAYVAAPNSDVTAQEIRRHLLAWLPVHAMPSIVAVHQSLPMTIQGKIDISRLVEYPRDECRSGQQEDKGDVGMVPPEIAEMWQTLTGATPQTLDADFLLDGGSSLAALRLVADFNSRFDSDLTIEMFVECPTPRTLVDASLSSAKPDRNKG